MVTQERWEAFTAEDHHTWKILFERQSALLRNRAVNEIVAGMETLSICHDRIPKFSELNAILKRETDFSVIPVTGLIPADLFFKFLSQRKFPSTCFIRKPHQLDYLEEPDIFHDVFGHVPLLVNPVFGNFMQAFGLKALKAIDLGLLDLAATLYWFTVEFGLMKTPQGLRIYGAGVTSSKGESIYSLESDVPTRKPFDIHKVVQTVYDTGSFQKDYFVIDGFNQLFEALNELEWRALKAEKEQACV
jgi:phenylalanine-4-hydroxylase